MERPVFEANLVAILAQKESILSRPVADEIARTTKTFSDNTPLFALYISGKANPTPREVENLQSYLNTVSVARREEIERDLELWEELMRENLFKSLSHSATTPKDFQTIRQNIGKINSIFHNLPTTEIKTVGDLRHASPEVFQRRVLRKGKLVAAPSLAFAILAFPPKN